MPGILQFLTKNVIKKARNFSTGFQASLKNRNFKPSHDTFKVGDRTLSESDVNTQMRQMILTAHHFANIVMLLTKAYISTPSDTAILENALRKFNETKQVYSDVSLSNLNFIKMHSLSIKHVMNSILERGPPIHYDTQLSEGN